MALGESDGFLQLVGGLQCRLTAWRDVSEVFAGALGDEHLLEYTVIGDTVNVAERLERLTREFGSPLVVSARLLAAAGERIVDDRWVQLAAQTLSGHRAQIESFAMRNSHSGSRVLPLP